MSGIWVSVMGECEAEDWVKETPHARHIRTAAIASPLFVRGLWPGI